MSSGQKQKAGQGQFPQINPIQCEFVTDIHNKKTVQFGTIDYAKKLFEGMILRFDKSVQPECSSAILAVFNELPYILKRKENETNLRWRLQVPMASKMLCIVDNNESLVNGCNFLQKRYFDANLNNIYHNGNFLDRGSVSGFFGIPDVDTSTLLEHRTQRQRDYWSHLTPDEQVVLQPLFQKSLREQLQSNMFHYLVEYVLTDLTGQNMIQHNLMRKHSQTDFRDLIVRKYQHKDRDYYFNKLSKELDRRGAQAISGLLTEISKKLRHYIERNQSEQLNQLADNWFLNNQVLTDMGVSFSFNFEDYANDYLMIGVMSGMEEAETPVQDSQPFLGLSEHRYSLHQQSGQVSHAKRRQRTSIELLNDRAEESSFTPKYVTGITEEIADNYFRLGFVGMYVSNKKTEGFSDPNLHTIINAAENAHDSNNSPISLIQGIGRARGLDETALPHYIYGLGREQESSFELKHLASDDYYPELFRAQKRFDKSYIAILGEQVGKDIISWYHQNQEGDASIDPDLLKRKVLYLVANALRQLNIQSMHRIDLSRAELPKVIAYAMKKLDKEIAHTQHPYQLSLFIRVVGTLLNFVCECYFTVLRFKPWLAMMWHARTLALGLQPRQSLNEQTRTCDADARALRSAEADKVYLKIIRQAHFKDLIAQGLIAAEFKAWLMQKTEATKIIVAKFGLHYLKPEIRAEIEQHLNLCIFPLFEKMVVPGKAGVVREKMQNFDGLLMLLEKNAAALAALQQDCSDEQFAEMMLNLLHKVPGLEALNAEDIVNYPNQAKISLEWFQQLSVSTLSHEPALKDQISAEVTGFLSNDLQQYLGAFVTYPDKLKILSVLQQNPERVGAFVDHYIDQQAQDIPENAGFANLLKEFQTFFSLETVQLLPEKVGEAKLALEEYQLSCIADLMQRELLPCMVNLYPLSDRERLLSQISRESIEHLLRSQQRRLQGLLDDNDPQAIAGFFFNSICTSVPPFVDIEAEKAKSVAFMKQQTQGMTGVSMGARSLMDRAAKRLTGSDIGLLSGKFQTLLVTDRFFETISLLLPFHHWQSLKLRFKQEPDKVKILANKLSCYVNDSDDLTPDILLQEINTAFATQYQPTPDYAADIGKQVRGLSQAQYTHDATPALKSQLALIVKEHCLPMLASYIMSDDLKHQFLHYDYEPQHLCDFFVRNFASFQSLAELSPENQIQLVSNYCDFLCPNLVDYNALTDPKEHAEERSKASEALLRHKVKTIFAMSDACKNRLSHFFNAADTQLLQTSLGIREETEALVSALPEAANHIDQTSLMHTVRTAVPRLQTIELVSERLEQFKIKTSDLLSLGHAVFDSAKLADTVAEQIKPILAHSQFINLLNLYIGSLTDQDLNVIFSGRGIANSALSARQLLRFKELIVNKDFATFKQEFIQCAPGQNFDFEHAPIKQVLENFAILAEEVIACHCYYQQHDEKGGQRFVRQPGFFDLLSDTAKEIQVPAFDDFMSHFSRRIFFIQGVRNGLPKAGKVYADSHQETIENLQSINNDLLRPLWWSVNAYSLFYKVMVGAKTVLFFLQDVLQRLIEAVNDMINWLFGMSSTNAMPATANIQEDYNLSAFTTAEVINNLVPLTKEQVAEQNCPEDVIQHVERAITQLPGHRLRLFSRRRQIAEYQGDLLAVAPVFG